MTTKKTTKATPLPLDYDWNSGVLERIAPAMTTAPAGVVLAWNSALEHRNRTERLRQRCEDLSAEHRQAKTDAQAAVDNAEPAADLLKKEADAREELDRATQALSRATYGEQVLIDELCNAVQVVKREERIAWGLRIKEQHIDPRATGLKEAIKAVLPNVEEHFRAWGLLAWVLDPVFGSQVRVNGPYPTVNGLDVDRSSRALLQLASELEGGDAVDEMLAFLTTAEVEPEPQLSPEQRRATFGRKGEDWSE